MRLMEVILTLEQGGAQSLLLEKSRYLQSQGYSLVILAFYDGVMRSAFEQAGIPVHLIRPKRYPLWVLPLFLVELLRIQRELSALLQQYQIEIIQSHILSLYDFLLPSLHSPSLKTRIWTFHNTEFEIQLYDRFGLKTRLYRWLYPRFAKDIDAIVAVSSGVKAAIASEFAFTGITVIENAIPVEKFQVSGNRAAFCQAEEIPQDAQILLAIGRLTAQKGHSYLLEAFSKLLQDYPNAYLCLVGAGELEADLKAIAPPNTRFLGLRQDIAELLSNADIFVLPSLWEGLSQALLEAMAASKAIVATGVSGTVALIEDGQNGKLVAPRDVAALVQAISELLENPAQREKLGASAYQTVREAYDISRLGKDYIDFYQSLRAKSARLKYNDT